VRSSASKIAGGDEMSRLLEQLSRELGHDAVEEANRRHPELRTLPDAHVAELIAAVDYVMEFQNWPRTPRPARLSLAADSTLLTSLLSTEQDYCLFYRLGIFTHRSHSNEISQ